MMMEIEEGFVVGEAGVQKKKVSKSGVILGRE